MLLYIRYIEEYYKLDNNCRLFIIDFQIKVQTYYACKMSEVLHRSDAVRNHLILFVLRLFSFLIKWYLERFVPTFKPSNFLLYD